MNKKKITIWDREFELNVIYECYPGEEVLQSQKDAVSWLDDENIILSTLDIVKDYVCKTANEKLNLPIENIFKYVIPKNIFIPHSNKDTKLAIMCNYKFDIEHGIAIVFENRQFKEIGMQDIIL